MKIFTIFQSPILIISFRLLVQLRHGTSNIKLNKILQIYLKHIDL